VGPSISLGPLVTHRREIERRGAVFFSIPSAEQGREDAGRPLGSASRAALQWRAVAAEHAWVGQG
jgi:hypothetical protein